MTRTDRPANSRPRWARGDLHVHSVHSDGQLTPADLVTAARSAGLDFIASTEHNTTAAHDAWDDAAGGLLVILGEEVTTPGGHWLALGLHSGQLIDWHYGAADGAIDAELDRVHRVGGLAVVAHPHAPYPTGSFEHPYRGFDAVEVWNGLWSSDRPWNADNEAALADWTVALAEDVPTGRWRPAIGNSDTHLPDQLGIPQTVVLAERLDSAAVLAGLRAGRCWIAGSGAVDLRLKATAGAGGKVGGGAAGIGERLDTGGGLVSVSGTVRGVPGGTVTLHDQDRPVRAQTLPGNGSGAFEWEVPGPGRSFVRLEVRHPDGAMAALTNPILLG